MKKMSPLDIYDEEFSKSTFGGYNTVEVDNFKDKVGRAYEQLLKEINNFKEENTKLKEKLSNYESIEEKLTETLTSIQEVAREQTKQAQREADRIIEQAHMEADKIINNTKANLREEYRKLEQLQEARELYRIRFKNILESHLEMLEEEEKENINMDNFDDLNLDE